MPDTEVGIELKTTVDNSGINAATKGFQDMGKAAEESCKASTRQMGFQEKFMKRLIGTAALVALAFMAIKKAVNYISSGISDALNANEDFRKNVAKAQENFGKLKSFIADSVLGILGLKSGSMDLSKIAVFLANAWQNMVGSVQWLISGIADSLLAAVEALFRAVSKVDKSFKSYVSEIEKSRAGWQELNKASIEKLGWDENILANQKDYAKEIEKQKKIEQEREAAAKKAAEEEKRRLEQFAHAVENMRQSARDRQIEFTASLATGNRGDIFFELEEQKKLNDALIEAKLKIYEQDTDNYKLALEERTILDEEYQAKQKVLTENLSEFQLSTLRAYATTQSREFQATSDIILSLSDTIQQTNLKNSTLAKILATANATINTYQAATKALASVPYPYNFVAMATTIAAGLAQVAQIAAVPLAQGGLVKATTGGVPAIIGEGRSDEAVIPLNNSTMNRLGGAISDNMSGGNNISINQNINIANGNDIESIIESIRKGTVEGLTLAGVAFNAGQKQSRLAI